MMNWKDLIIELLEKNRFPFVMMLCGIVLATCGAVGAVPYLISSIDMWGRIALLSIGVLVVILAAIIYTIASTGQLKTLNAIKYKFIISHPKNESTQMTMNGFFDMSGSYNKEPPDGYSLAIVELIGPNNGFAFRREDVKLEKQNKTWYATGVWGGTEHKTQKEFAIVLIGPDGKALQNYWKKVGEKYNWEIPPIDTWAADMLVCDQIRIDFVNK
jgi:hypothetical protein